MVKQVSLPGYQCESCKKVYRAADLAQACEAKHDNNCKHEFRVHRMANKDGRNFVQLVCGKCNLTKVEKSLIA